jgi:hypothetical protein
MPVRKFRSIEAMNEVTERERMARGVDWEAIAHVLAIAGAGAPRRMVPGVHKFRTIAEWNAASEKWEQAAVDMAAERSRAARGRDMAPLDVRADDPQPDRLEP